MRTSGPGIPVRPSSRGRRFGLLATVAVVVTIALGGAGFATSYLLGYATAHYHAANAADDLTRDLGELVGVTNDLASSLKSAPAISVTATERGVAADLAELQRNGFESSAVNPLSDKIRTYVAGVDRERRLALDGRTGEVQALAGQQDALFHILATQAASVVQQLRRQADDASRMV